ncbi:MFS transporter [Paracoccus aminophilus]|uniref:MFS transporter n=1 Tax=Paracoccus aminophilus TaxID=34003 RepID=UPI0011DD91EA|nr:MFS transporter [Paracoccus aminophilus]
MPGLIYLILGGRQSPLGLLIIAACIAGYGYGLIFLGSLAEITRCAPPEHRAETVSTYYVIVYLGIGMPMIAVGYLATYVGLSAAVQSFSAALIPAVLAVLILMRRLPSSLSC